ncbi:hypothetical protein ABPG77_003613 [Micractinium sp. CCAP 211/92]
MEQQAGGRQEEEEAQIKAELLKLIQRENVTRLPTGDAKALSFAFNGSAALFHRAARRHFLQTTKMRQTGVIHLLSLAAGQHPKESLGPYMLEGFAALVEQAVGLQPGEQLAPADLLRRLDDMQDLPLAEWCEVFEIPQDDPRVALRGARGVRVRPDWPHPIPAGSVVGVYRAEVWFKFEQPVVQQPPPGWANGCPLLFEAARGAYIVETDQFEAKQAYGNKLETLGFKFDRRRKPNDYTLVYSAYQCGNGTMLVNAPQIDPYSFEGHHKPGGVVGAANCNVFEVLVAGTPFMVQFTTAALQPGSERAKGCQELLYPYGWATYFEPAAAEIDRAVAAEIRVRKAVAAAAAAAGSEAVASGEAGPQQGAAAQQDSVDQQQQQQQQQPQRQVQPQPPQPPQPQPPQTQTQTQTQTQQQHPAPAPQSQSTAVAAASAPAAGPRRTIARSRKLTAACAVRLERSARPAVQPAGRAPKRGLDGACRGNPAEPAAELAAAVEAEVSAALATARQQMHQAVGVHRQQEVQQRQPVYEASRPRHQHQHGWQAEPAAVAQAVEVIDLTGDD